VGIRLVERAPTVYERVLLTSMGPVPSEGSYWVCAVDDGKRVGFVRDSACGAVRDVTVALGVTIRKRITRCLLAYTALTGPAVSGLPSA
jgi:hypothetical protein